MIKTFQTNASAGTQYSIYILVDGQWSGFGDWGECSVPCGGGIMPRRRTCDNPPPAYGGANCEGDDAEIQDCNIDPCPGKLLSKFRYVRFKCVGKNIPLPE